MIKMHHATLLLSALFLSACASQPKEKAAAPAPVAAEQQVAAEPAQAPVAEQTAAPVAVVVATPAQKPAVKKARKAKKKVAKAVPPAMEAAPVAEPPPAPAPMVKEEAPAHEITPAPVVAAPTPVAEEGFLKKYWMWLLGLVIAVIALSFFVKKKD